MLLLLTQCCRSNLWTRRHSTCIRPKRAQGLPTLHSPSTKNARIRWVQPWPPIQQVLPRAAKVDKIRSQFRRVFATAGWVGATNVIGKRFFRNQRYSARAMVNRNYSARQNAKHTIRCANLLCSTNSRLLKATGMNFDQM